MIDELIKVKEFIQPPWELSSICWFIWVLWAFFVGWNLRHPGDGRNYLLKTIRKAKLGKKYRERLSDCLDYTAQRWFKDADAIERHRNTAKNTHTS